MAEVAALRVRRDRGVTLVEVLVTLIILAIGLLGLVALHARVQVLQAESYQRAQALILLKDMAGRIANNRNNVATYVAEFAGQDMATEGVGAHLDAGDCPAPDGATPRAQADVADWCAALRGAAESLDGTNVGAMVGGRGCVQDLGGGRFLVTVAWQGLAPIQAPPETVTCGEDQYGEEDTPCEGDVCRRVVTTVVQLANLDVDEL
jgi:type IV pilus assembly protein PilV